MVGRTFRCWEASAACSRHRYHMSDHMCNGSSPQMVKCRKYQRAGQSAERERETETKEQQLQSHEQSSRHDDNSSSCSKHSYILPAFVLIVQWPARLLSVSCNVPSVPRGASPLSELLHWTRESCPPKIPKVMMLL